MVTTTFPDMGSCNCSSLEKATELGLRSPPLPSLFLLFLTYYDAGTKVYPSAEVSFSWRRLAMSADADKSKESLERRMERLSNMAVEVVNMLATKKVNGKTINVADIYFVLSRALQHVSLLNLAEIEEHRRVVSVAKRMVV